MSGGRSELFAHLDALYRRHGLLDGDGQGRPLWQVCEHSADCWNRVAEKRKNGLADPTVGGIFRPWVGERYRPAGTAIIGLNLRTNEAGNHKGGLAAEEKIAHEQLQVLRTADRPRRPHKSPFAYGSTWALALIARWREGLELPDGYLPPEELVAALSSSVRLQAVKCSPIGHRSHPTHAMCRHCPSHLLEGELEILRPSVLVGFGADAQRAMSLIGASVTVDGGYGRGSFQMGWGRVVVFVLCHPSARVTQWRASLQRLVDDLRADLASVPAG